MAPHTINTDVADRQLGKCYFLIKTGSYLQNIIINANSNKY